MRKTPTVHLEAVLNPLTHYMQKSQFTGLSPNKPLPSIKQSRREVNRYQSKRTRRKGGSDMTVSKVTKPLYPLLTAIKAHKSMHLINFTNHPSGNPTLIMLLQLCSTGWFRRGWRHWRYQPTTMSNAIDIFSPMAKDSSEMRHINFREDLQVPLQVGGRPSGGAILPADWGIWLYSGS